MKVWKYLKVWNILNTRKYLKLFKYLKVKVSALRLQQNKLYLVLFWRNAVAADRITIWFSKSGAKLVQIYFVYHLCVGILYFDMKQCESNDLSWGKKGDLGVVALLFWTVPALQNLRGEDKFEFCWYFLAHPYSRMGYACSWLISDSVLQYIDGTSESSKISEPS